MKAKLYCIPCGKFTHHEEKSVSCKSCHTKYPIPKSKDLEDNLDKVIAVALYQAQQHNFNYYILMSNPDENGHYTDKSEFSYVAAPCHVEKGTVILTDTEQLNLDLKKGSKNPMDVASEVVGGIAIHDKLENGTVTLTSTTERDYYKLPTSVSPRKVEKKTQRNAKCPCGSGLKHKKCCLIN